MRLHMGERWSAIAKPPKVTSGSLRPAGWWSRAPAGSNRLLVRPRRAGRALRPLPRPLMWTVRGRRCALGRFMRHPERLTPTEAFAVAEAYITAPAYTEASALMRA